MPQDASGFIKSATWEFQITLRGDRKMFPIGSSDTCPFPFTMVKLHDKKSQN